MKFIVNKTQTNIFMFGGTVAILRGGFAKVSDQSAETDEAFKLEQLRMIEIHSELPAGYSNDPVEPTYEVSTLDVKGSDVYPEKKAETEVQVVESKIEVQAVEEAPVATTKTKTTKAK